MAGATRAAAAAASGKAIKALVLDFDSTISTPTFLERANQWAVADNVPLFESMSAEERVANFGGKARIEQLASCLKDLKVRPSRSDRQDSLQRMPKPLGLLHLNAIQHPPKRQPRIQRHGPPPSFHHPLCPPGRIGRALHRRTSMSKARLPRLGPAGSPEASLSARARLRPPRASASLGPSAGWGGALSPRRQGRGLFSGELPPATCYLPND